MEELDTELLLSWLQVEGYQAKFERLEGELKRSKRTREEAAEATASKQKVKQPC